MAVMNFRDMRLHCSFLVLNLFSGDKILDLLVSLHASWWLIPSFAAVRVSLKISGCWVWVEGEIISAVGA